MLSYTGVLYRQHLQKGVSKGAFTQEEADKRFEAWAAEKSNKVQGKKDRLAKEKSENLNKIMKHEREVNENRLKAITGRDAITARFLHREFFDFAPTHKFWISGNHKPTVRGTDHGIWRRMRLIPFAVTIPKEERDLDLADKLRAEMTGILNWAIQGCLAWQRDGLVTPQCVIAATASYQAQEDILGQFLEDSTEMGDEDARTLQCEVFTAYVRWTDQQGIKKPLSATMLNRKLEDRGFQKSKSNSKRYWKGISIKPW